MLYNQATTYEDGPATLVTSGAVAAERLVPMRPQSNTRESLHWLSRDEYDLWSQHASAMDALHAEYLTELPESGYVYFAEMEIKGQYGPSWDGSGRFKIGMSRDPEQRMREISRVSVKMPYTIHLRHKVWCEQMRDTERCLHKMLSRFRLDGEWFHLPQEIDESLGGLWYVRSGSRGLRFVDLSGAEHSPLGFLKEQIRSFRRMAALQREAWEKRNADSGDS